MTTRTTPAVPATDSPTATDLQQLRERYPTLGCGGLHDSAHPITESSLARIRQVCQFLAQHTRATSGVKDDRSSYAWKHIAEHALGAYVSNGEFIAAALLSGHRLKPCWSARSTDPNPNAFLNIEARSRDLKDMLRTGYHRVLPIENSC